jgi:hypothetical protein
MHLICNNYFITWISWYCMLICVFVNSRFVDNPPVGSWETNPYFLWGVLSQLLSEQDQAKTHTKASKNRNNVVGKERLAHIRTIVVCLGGKLTYVFFMQLWNCVDEGMSWFFEYWSYFVVDDLVLLFVTLVELLELVDAFFYCFWGLFCLCLVVGPWCEKPTRGVVWKAHYMGVLVKGPWWGYLIRFL